MAEGHSPKSTSHEGHGDHDAAHPAHAGDAHAAHGTVETVPGHADAHGHDEAHGGDHGGGGPVDVPMFITFLVIFGVAAAILKKLAWGPILDGLDARESEIAQSLEDAETIQREMSKLDETVKAKINEADTEAAELVERGRRGGKKLAASIEHQAKEQAKIFTENAEREIETARAKAAATLREESADAAVALATKLLNEKLDDTERKALTDRLIAEM